MQKILCTQCGTAVLAEKYSEQHTSVQWLDDAFEVCPRLKQDKVAGDALRAQRAIGAVCPALHATIDQAAQEGNLPLSLRSEPTAGVLQ
ncbi:MAG: hypothetical protein L0H93_06930 [Nocardioides sp.]|nr:hypothetical protein [Nocardioides sp.]